MLPGSFSDLARLTAQLGGVPSSVSPHLPRALAAVVPAVWRVPRLCHLPVCQGSL